MSSSSRVGAINRRWLSYRPTGYLTNEDYAQAERLRRRTGESAGAFGAQEATAVQRRAEARGIAGGPALERDIARVRQNEGDIIEAGGQQAESNLYNTSLNREQFEREKGLRAWGSELQDEYNRQQRSAAREGAIWNTFNQFLPYVFDFATGGAGAALPTGALAGALGGDNGESYYSPPVPQTR